MRTTKRVIACLLLGCGWPLFLYFLGEYSKVKLECETYVSYAAKVQARDDFHAGRFALLVLPNGQPNVTTNSHDLQIKAYTNTSPFSELFVREYNKRMAKLVDTNGPNHR